MGRLVRRKPHIMNRDRRWYDQDPQCSKLIDVMKDMRHEMVQGFSAQCLIHFTERIRKFIQEKRNSGAPVSLGLPALQGLYMAKVQHRRWYDHDTNLQRAIGGLYGLPKEGLSVLGFKLHEPFGLMALYSFVCDQVGQDPVIEDLVSIFKTGIQVGKQEAEEVLADIIGRELYEAFSQEFET